MTRYIIRRIFTLFPIVLGVLLITFLLFNVVGGSPASMALGKNASPQALEEFDEQRGFNKPVLAGWWTSTRACPDAPFMAPIRLSAVTGTPVTLLFPLRPDTVYRLRCGIIPAAGLAGWQPGPGVIALSPTNQVQELMFRTGVIPTATPVTLFASQGGAELGSLRLERRMPHGYDSQLTHYFKKLARFDLGTSLSTNEKVTVMLRRGLMPSLALTVPIFLGGLVLSVTLALACAYWRDRLTDRVLVFTSVALMSVNYLVWIIFGQFVLAYKLQWFPIWGFESWRYLLLPVCIGIVSGLGANLRFYRTIFLDEMYKDYVRTAYAKGLGPVAVLFRHVLPNAMIPIVTNTVIALPFLYTGSLLLESFFGIPGLGGLSVNAVNSSDVDVVRGVVLIGSVLYVIAGLVSDLCYALVDPRVVLK